jgi:glycosyltransferase involved in cell wall biosynthesis
MTGLVVIPVFNEAENLQRVIDSLRDRLPIDNLLFIDDGSSDGSHLLLERAGLNYLRHPVNLGYEETLKTGMREVLSGGHQYVAFFDGDGQHRIEDLETIIRSYETDPCDLIIGSRYRGVQGTRISLRSVGTRMFSWLTTMLARVEITDVTCGMKLISRRFIPVALKLPTEDMHAELIVGLSRCGARIREEKITVLPREAGQSMYHLYKGLLYPAKTFLCLLGELTFYRTLKRAVGSGGEGRISEAQDNPPREIRRASKGEAK